MRIQDSSWVERLGGATWRVLLVITVAPIGFTSLDWKRTLAVEHGL